LGVHFTSDVAAGWLLGVAVVAATTVAFRLQDRRRRPAAVEGVEPELADGPPAGRPGVETPAAG
jgi:membrane-associated phospholipid phosphatase